MLMFVHKGEHIVYRMLANNGVRVKQEYVFTCALLYGNVIGTRETEITIATNDVHIWELLRQILHAPIIGMVVDYIHFGLYTVNSPKQRVQALFDIETYFIADYND